MTTKGVTAEEAYQAARQLAAFGKYSSAIAAYSDAIAANPNHIAAQVGRGLALQQLGDHANAVADFDRVISTCPDWSGAFVAFYSRALSRQASGQYDKAMSDCNTSISMNAEHAQSFYLRGTMRKAFGHVEAAISDMNAALKIEPSYWEAYLERGKLYSLQQSWQRAVADFTEALEYGSAGMLHIRECLFLRGIAEQSLGDHQAAIADFTRTIELAPENCAAFLRRSWSYRMIGEHALADADLQAGVHLQRGEGLAT